jgi:hypothetical protein
VVYQHPLAYLLGLEGIALLRAFAGEYDRDFTMARLAEVRALLDAVDELGDGTSVDPISTSEGYRSWAAFCDYLAAALLLDLQVRRCEELRRPFPLVDDGDLRSATGDVFPDHDPVLPRTSGHCIAGLPSATNAANRESPAVVVWHFELG